MNFSLAHGRRRRAAWALHKPAEALPWELGIAWSSIAAVADASTGRRVVLSGLVLVGPYLVFLSGRWLRTAVAGAWAVGLVVLLGFPDGIWGSRLEAGLISLAVFVAATSTLVLLITVRSVLSLTVTALLAAACGGQGASPGRGAAEKSSKPASCREQYEAWKRGPGLAAEAKLGAAVHAVQAAEQAGSTAPLAAQMRKLMPAAVAAGLAGPIPSCADPRGLYRRYITVIYQAGHNAGKASGLAALRKAAGPLRDLTAIQSTLAAEAGRALAPG